MKAPLNLWDYLPLGGSFIGWSGRYAQQSVRLGLSGKFLTRVKEFELTAMLKLRWERKDPDRMQETEVPVFPVDVRPVRRGPRVVVPSNDRRKIVQPFHGIDQQQTLIKELFPAPFRPEAQRVRQERGGLSTAHEHDSVIVLQHHTKLPPTHQGHPAWGGRWCGGGLRLGVTNHSSAGFTTPLAC